MKKLHNNQSMIAILFNKKCLFNHKTKFYVIHISELSMTQKAPYAG